MALVIILIRMAFGMATQMVIIKVILMTLIATSSKLCSLEGLQGFLRREEGHEEGAALAAGLSSLGCLRGSVARLR